MKAPTIVLATGKRKAAVARATVRKGQGILRYNGVPLELVEPEPLELCAALERLLDEPAIREKRSRAGIDLMATRTWARAAEQVEEGLRAALEPSSAAF